MKNDSMYDLCWSMFKYPRSITGDGVRKTLRHIKEYLPTMNIHEIPSGTKCFDWEVPKEWNCHRAYITCPDGSRICEFKVSNLHVVGYSVPVNDWVTLDELQKHLYSIPDKPDAIPYVTSYYEEKWGFCISDKERDELKEGLYHVYIDSEFKDGSLSYGELIIPGDLSDEIFLSTYICHPSLANDNLSGIAVTTYLAKWIMGLSKQKYTYRIIFVPETIGSIAYLSKYWKQMRQKVIAGFNVTCVGDNLNYSYMPSRNGNTLADMVAQHVLSHLHPEYKTYSFLDRGSDERQYCSPGIDLPVCSIIRSGYKYFPQYHTSWDDLSFISREGLQGGYESLKAAISCIEENWYPKVKILCEPQLGKRGLYPTRGIEGHSKKVRNMMNFLTYCDGLHSILDICNIIDVPMWELSILVETLKDEGIIE